VKLVGLVCIGIRIPPDLRRFEMTVWIVLVNGKIDASFNNEYSAIKHAKRHLNDKLYHRA